MRAALSKAEESLTQSPAAYTGPVPTVTVDDLRLKNPPPIPKNIRKTQFSLEHNIVSMVNHYGLERILFVTLTFPKAMTIAAAGKIRNSLLTNLIRKRYEGYLWVMEPEPTGRIHFHFLLPVRFDTHHRTFLDAWQKRSRFTAKQRVQAMNPELQAEDHYWKKARRYGFGIHELAPLYSSATAIARYLTKFEWQWEEWGFSQTKRIRFSGVSGNLKSASSNLAWVGGRSRKYRDNTRLLASAIDAQTTAELAREFGNSWAYRLIQEGPAPMLGQWSERALMAVADKAAPKD